MASDIISAVKGLFPSIYTQVDVPKTAENSAERASRDKALRQRQLNTKTQNALTFFKGKRLLGGNLLFGGGTVNTEQTRNFYAGLQQAEDDQYRLLIEQATSKIEQGQYKQSPSTRPLPQVAVNQLLRASASLDEVGTRYNSIDYQEAQKANAERQERINQLLEASRETIDSISDNNSLPKVSQRPRVDNIISTYLLDNDISENLHLILERRLTSLRLDQPIDQQVINIDQILREKRQNTFLGLNTDAEIKARQIELKLTDEQVQEETLKDARSIPTYVQVELLGRKNSLSKAFIDSQQNIDPTFSVAEYESAKGTLTTTDKNGITRTLNSDLNAGGRRHILTYLEYLNLQYTTPQVQSDKDQIEYLNVVPFDSLDAKIDENDRRGSVQTVALITPKTDDGYFVKTSGVLLGSSIDEYTKIEFTIPIERESLFQGVELNFGGTTFPITSPYQSVLAQLESAPENIKVEVTQLGINKNYIGNQRLLLEQQEDRNENTLRFRFFAQEPAQNGLKVVIHLKEDSLGVPLVELKNLNAKFF